MMELARHEGWHLELCRHNRAVLETPTIRDDTEKRHNALSRAVLYLVLAPHEPEQADLTHRLLADKLLDEIPTYKYVMSQRVSPVFPHASPHQPKLTKQRTCSQGIAAFVRESRIDKVVGIMRDLRKGTQIDRGFLLVYRGRLQAMGRFAKSRRGTRKSSILI